MAQIPTENKLVEALGPKTTRVLLLAREQKDPPITLGNLNNPNFVEKFVKDKKIEATRDDMDKIKQRLGLAYLKDKLSEQGLKPETTVDAFYKLVESHVNSPAHKIPDNQKVLPAAKKPAKPFGM